MSGAAGAEQAGDGDRGIEADAGIQKDQILWQMWNIYAFHILYFYIYIYRV